MLDTVKIGGLTYSLAVVDQPSLNGEPVLGMIDYDSQEIYLDKEQHPELFIVTVIHEILHGIVHDRKLPLGSYEEAVVDGFSRGIFQILIDNPALVDELKKYLEQSK